MERNLFRYIWQHTRRQQIFILFIVLASMPTYFLSFDLPKQIVNGPIQGRGFDQPGATQSFLNLSLDLPGLGEVELFPGFQLDRMEMLFALSFLFLLLVIINGLFKRYINTYKGRLGERMLRRLRYTLFDRVLRFPIGRFRRTKSSEVATIIKDEVEPLGGFIGDAFVQPFFLGGQAATAMIFIIVQSVPLGCVAAAIVGVQAFIIPRMRRHLIRLNTERQITARQLAGRIGEVVDGIQGVHANDTSNYERADIASRLSRIFFIRFELYQRKFSIKFLNNLLAQITPFVFYAAGGYLALKGQLDIGQLVAVIAAYKDLPSPIKELIDWDQQRVDVQVKYQQVIEQFSSDTLLDPAMQPLDPDGVSPLAGSLQIAGVSVSDDSGARLLERVTLTAEPGERIAILGGPGSGAEALAETIIRFHPLDSGRIAVGEINLASATEAVLGRRIGYAGGDGYLPNGTVRDALVYSLKHVPSDGGGEHDPLSAHEATAAGNPLLDIDDDWISYASAGIAGPEALEGRLHQLLEAAGLMEDIFEFGLRARIDPEERPHIAEEILRAQEAFSARLEEPPLKGLVVRFDPDAYNSEATVLENLLFGAPIGGALSDGAIMENRHFRRVIAETGLEPRLLAMGRTIAETVVELFKDLPPDHPFFEQLSFMSADDIPEYQAILQRLGENGTPANADDHDRLVMLAFGYVEPRHRFGLVDQEFSDAVLAARRMFRDELPGEYAALIAFHDPGVFNPAALLLDNILSGRVVNAIAGAADKVNTEVRKLLIELGIYDEIVEAGLYFETGSGGKRLTAGQRQRIQIARALIKRPDIAIFNRPLSALDPRGQEKVVKAAFEDLYADGRKPIILWVLNSAPLARLFDRAVVFDGIAVAEDGKPEELMKSGGLYAKMAGA
ncbi:MAG: ABC transporter transmembrane domain-containing protein [Flavobacteriaceae bacterium]